MTAHEGEYREHGFTKIIDGEIPGRSSGRMTSAWRSGYHASVGRSPTARSPALRLTVGPICRLNWPHLFAVAHKISGALDQAFDKDHVALMIAGFDVPHTHIHLFPADGMADYDPANAKRTQPLKELDAAAERSATPPCASAVTVSCARGVSAVYSAI